MFFLELDVWAVGLGNRFFCDDQKDTSSSWIIDLARVPPERRHHHTPKTDVIDELYTQNEGTRAAHETCASYAIATMGLYTH
jgi:hypothetical protein